MDSRLIIMGAAAVLVVVALVVLVALLTARSRRVKREALAADQVIWSASRAPLGETGDSPSHTAPAAPVPESPSAELLTPLPTGDWRPPLEPAPAAHLPAVSLAERTRGFGPSVSPAAPASATPDPPPGDHAKRLETLPVVRPVSQSDVATPLVTAEPEPAFVWQPSVTEPHSEVLRSVEPATTVSPEQPQRPKAHARVIPEGDTAAPAQAESPARTHEPRLGVSADFVEMVAPIEMWFGDYRVGVKSGSKTHAQFRKYADALLGDLRGRKERT